MFFEWNNKFETGIDRIDFQHRRLVNIINQIHDSSKSTTDLEKMVMNLALEQLIDYTIYHFSSEEDYMKQIKFPDLDKHVHEHRILQAAVQKYYTQYKAGQLQVSELLEFLVKWLNNHILQSDKEITSVAKAAGY